MAMVTLILPNCAVIRTLTDDVCFEHAQNAPSFGGLGNHTASSGDASMLNLLCWCLR